jgi:hypothetical protein
MKSTVLSLLGAYIILLVIFVVLMICTYLIPKNAIRDNVIDSALIIQKEGQYPMFHNLRLTKLDNYTDATMLNIAISTDEEHLLTSAMADYYYYDTINRPEKAYIVERVAKDDTYGMKRLNYGRYWQGYQVTLRPALCIFGIRGIRILNYILLTFLTVVCIWLLWNLVGRVEALMLLISLLVVFFPVVPYSMQYSTCFYLMFLAMIALIAFPKLTADNRNVMVTFFCIGAITVFMDFLTTPQLTIGMPLIAAILVRKPKNAMQWVILAAIAWGMGYALLWASKWLLGYLLTDFDLLADAMEQVEYRTSHEYNQTDLTIPTVFNYVLFDNSIHSGWIILAVAVVAILVYLWLQKGWNVQKSYAWLLLIALIVPVWYIIMRQHSVMHRWFTVRAFLVTIYSILLWVYYTVCKSPTRR